MTKEDDKLPLRFHTEPVPESGAVISPEQMELMLSEYYQARGWDPDGVPLRD